MSKLTLKSYVLPLVTLAVAFLVACQPADRRIETIGTGDGGGGNTCKGKPFESYALDVENHEAYKTHIAPKLEQMGEASQIRQVLTHAVSTKTWFLMPCEFNKLSAEKIGTLSKNQQGALQSMEEVWLSQPALEDEFGNKVYEGAELDFAKLIVHEMLMSIRLLKFESAKNKCLALAPDSNYCNNTDEARSGAPKDLTDEDYSDIREATTKFFEQTNLDARGWEEFLAVHDFQFSDTRVFMRAADIIEITNQEVREIIMATVAAGEMPNMGWRTSSVDGSQSLELEDCSFEYESSGTGPDLYKIESETFGPVLVDVFGSDRDAVRPAQSEVVMIGPEGTEMNPKIVYPVELVEVVFDMYVGDEMRPETRSRQ
ncbi:MAG: hypothetical protein HRT45_14270 [Bdellovibrionales bacterium]|nr:hypothetical protein [Bdellovibrionales bacterium]